MRAILIAVFCLCFSWPAAAAYDEARVVLTVQEALIRLGYDPGPADGAWGRKTRDALNALREAEGLPPADALTGSSLALVHRLSPGETTLPNPGFFFTDIAARREFLSQPDNTRVKRAFCPIKLGAGLSLDRVEVVPRIERIIKSQEWITDEEDWYSPIEESLMGTVNSCMSGNDDRCRAVIDFTLRWAEGDALQPTISRRADDFEQFAWIGNILLRDMIVAYGMVRQIHAVSPEQEAMVLDWFMRRVDDYHYFPPGIVTTNHALADMLPALALGVLVGDRTLMEPAIEVRSIGLDSMRADGSLPMEARRGARWAHYTNLQISQTMFVAEMAAGQGIDLYAGDAASGNTTQRAINWLFDGLEDFDIALPYARENHGSPGNYRIPFYYAHHYGWVPAYHARFGDDETMERMMSATIDPRICSPEAVDEKKTEGPSCWGFAGKPLSFVTSQRAMGLTPSHHMGYASGCVQGLPSLPLLLK